jgi:hypothetical protein
MAAECRIRKRHGNRCLPNTLARLSRVLLTLDGSCRLVRRLQRTPFAPFALSDRTLISFWRYDSPYLAGHCLPRAVSCILKAWWSG